MDFRQMSSTPVSRPEASTQNPPAPSRPQEVKKKSSFWASPVWLNVLSVVILFGVAVLLILMAVSFARAGGDSNEHRMVDKSKFQAVFLNNGQVYFGSITSLTDKYLTLNKVFYLTQGTTTGANGQPTTSGDYTLIKLGCQQIHNPTDQMVINRDQVTFWENLNKDGKVAQSIEQFKKQNPNGPNCTQQTSQTPATNVPSQSPNSGGTTQNPAVPNPTKP